MRLISSSTAALVVFLASAGTVLSAPPKSKADPAYLLPVGAEATIVLVGDETQLLPALGKSTVVTPDSLVLTLATEEFLSSDEFVRRTHAADADFAYGKAIRASDPDGISELISRFWAMRVPVGTKVRVIEVEIVGNTGITVADRLPFDARGLRVVRITEGPMKGRAVDIPARNLKPIGASAEKAESAKTRPADPAKRAATLLAAGKNLEKLKKIPAAIETYRRVVKEFAGTDQAKEAEARIKALGGK